MLFLCFIESIAVSGNGGTESQEQGNEIQAMISQVAAELEIAAQKALKGKGQGVTLSKRKSGTYTSC